MNDYINLSAKSYWDELLTNDDVDARLFLPSHDKDIQIELFRKYVTVVNIETSSFCNRVCDYCPNSLIDRRHNNVRMPKEVLKKVVRDLNDISFAGRVSMNLYNEPLADEKFPEFIQIVRSALPNVKISTNSNGDYLNNDLLKILADAGLDEIYVTLHVKPNEEYTDENRIESLIQFYRRQGVTPSVISFEPLKHIRTNYNLHGVYVEVQCRNWRSPNIGNNRGQKIEFLNIVDRYWPCMRPFREIVITHTCDTFPCCQFLPEFSADKKYSSGKVSDNLSIFEVYSSEIYSQFRKELFLFSKKRGVCANCSERMCTVDDSSSAIRKGIADRIKSENEIELL